METFGSILKYLGILAGTFGVSHLLFSLMEKAERLPFWLNPLRAALILTFLVQLWLLINAQSEKPEIP